MINVERFPFLIFVSMFRCSIHFEAFIFIRYYLCSLRFKTWFTWQSNSNAHNTFRFLSHLSSLCVTLNVAPNGRIVAETLLSYSFYLAFIWAFDVCDTQDNRTHFSFRSFCWICSPRKLMFRRNVLSVSFIFRSQKLDDFSILNGLIGCFEQFWIWRKCFNGTCNMEGNH